MAEIQKIVLPGETIYLDEDEDFNDVGVYGSDERELVIDNSEMNAKRLADEEALAKKKEKPEEKLMDIKKESSFVNTIEKVKEEMLTAKKEDIQPQRKIIEEPKQEDPDRYGKEIDISTLKLINKNSLEREKDLKRALYASKSAYQIVATQSGYTAKIIPLVNKDVFNIINSSMTRYEYKKELYRIIYNKIIEFSFGRIDFDNWLRMTSVEDIETFFYGLYCATFQNSASFSFECPDCKKEDSYLVNHNNLITATDRDSVKETINKINAESRTLESVASISLIPKKQCYLLTESKLIAEVKTPSLFDSLELLRNTSDEAINKDVDGVTNMLYISRFLIPDSAGNVTEEVDRKQILSIIDNLSIDDAAELRNSIVQRLDNHRITYSVKNITCSGCGKKTDNIPVDLEDLLFTAIYKKM